MKYFPTIPSSLLNLGRGDDGVDAFLKSNSDLSLKVGVIINSYDIQHAENISKKYIEYDILAFTQDKDLASVPVTYKRCKTADLFGGKADFLEYTLRATSKDPTTDDLRKIDDGSFVLLLCINGQTDDAIILAGIGHNKRPTTLTKENGHRLEGEFNGVNFQINKDGEFTITFKSASDNKGKYADEKAGGTHIQIDKTGQVDVNANLEGDKETYMRMDKKNMDVGLKAGRHIGFTAKGNIAQIADGNVKATAKGNLVMEAEGTANIESKGSFVLKAGGAMQMDFSDLQIKSGAGIMAKASQVIVDAPMIQLGNGGTPAIVLSTQVMAIGNLGAPVVGTMIGPFSPVVFIA